MTPEEFAYLRELLKRRSGLVLAEEKRYLLESRLTPLARKSGMRSLGELVAALQAPGGEGLCRSVVEAMMINESFFFRDKLPFENFRQVMVPELMKARGPSRRLHIWCTAASTGQEPYSLAILLKEMEEQLLGWQVEIIGTDLSGEALEKARSGLYSQFEVQRGLPIQKLVRYFSQVGSMWQINSALRAMVRFERFNLLEDFERLGRFDIVFCRNVLIYFEAETKRDILMRIAAQMAPDGYLVLGAAETVIGLNTRFRPLPESRGLYALSAAAAGPATIGVMHDSRGAKPAPRSSRGQALREGGGIGQDPDSGGAAARSQVSARASGRG